MPQPVPWCARNVTSQSGLYRDFLYVMRLTLNRPKMFVKSKMGLSQNESSFEAAPFLFVFILRRFFRTNSPTTEDPSFHLLWFVTWLYVPVLENTLIYQWLPTKFTNPAHFVGKSMSNYAIIRQWSSTEHVLLNIVYVYQRTIMLLFVNDLPTKPVISAVLHVCHCAATR